jgi:hypothetical protein
MISIFDLGVREAPERRDLFWRSQEKNLVATRGG